MYKKVIFLVVVCLLFTVTLDAQCAMCRAVLESEGNEETAKGINNGIVYLMAFPYLLVGTIGVFIYRSRKKAKKEGTI